MGLFDWLNSIDTDLFLTLHSGHGNFLDAFFILFTSIHVWIPLYLLLVFTIFKKYRPKAFWIFFLFVLTIVAADQISGLIKIWVERPRPSHVAALSRYLHLPTGAGGEFGFVSAHSANAFALAVLVGLVSKSRRLWIALLIWATVTAYSRIYVGVHYPFDVLCGGILGALIAWGIYGLMRWIDRKWLRKRIHHGGRWNGKETKPIVLALIFITATMLISAYIIGKFYTHIPFNG